MKLFVKGNKERPILFEGARELQGWISFISKHCPELGQGQGLTAAQWSAYAVKHQLVRRLGAVCAWFERANVEIDDLSCNPERWFAMLFQDPEALGVHDVADFAPTAEAPAPARASSEDAASVDASSHCDCAPRPSSPSKRMTWPCD